MKKEALALAPADRSLVEEGWFSAPDAVMVLTLTALAALLRLSPLDPSSLWVDDAWATLVVKAHTVHDVLLAGVTAPAFAVLLKGWLGLVGFSELNAQILPFMAGVVAPPLLYLVLRRLGIRRLGASMGSLLLLGSLVHRTYSTRVKQYTLEGLVAIIVLAVACWLISDVRSVRRWWTYALTCIGAIVLASPAIALAASSTGVALALLLQNHPRSVRSVMPPIALVAVFAALWWWFLLRPHVNDALKNYWSGYFVPYHKGAQHAVFVGARGLKDVGAGAVPLPAVAAVLCVAAAVIVLLASRRSVHAFLFVVGPLSVAVALAALHAVPLGTGRTDVYLYPGIAMGCAFAFDELDRRRPLLTALGGIILVALAVATFKPIGAYPPRDIRPLVDLLERRISVSDSVLVRPDDDYAFGLYGHWPLTFVHAKVAADFAVRIDRPNVHVPRLVPTGPRRSWESWPHAIAQAKAVSRRIWLLIGGHHPHPALPYVTNLLRNAGLVPAAKFERPGANLTLWVRR